MPEYPSKHHLEERLLLAIHEASEGFGFGCGTGGRSFQVNIMFICCTVVYLQWEMPLAVFQSTVLHCNDALFISVTQVSGVAESAKIVY